MLATDFGHVVQSLIALIIGALIGAIMYGLLKAKPTENELNALQETND